MKDILNCSISAFKTNLALYEKDFNSYVAKYPPKEEDLEEEKKCIQILQCVLGEVNRYHKLLKDDENYIIIFRLASYISTLSSMHLPLSSKIYKLLIKINEKIAI